VELELQKLKDCILSFRDSAFASGIKQVSLSLSGGDPLLYSRYQELVDFLVEQKFPFCLKANPSSLSENDADFLKGSTCQMVKMTFMGSRILHDRYRGIDTYETLVEKTRLLQNNTIPVVWHYSVGKFNAFPLRQILDSVLTARPDGFAIGRIARIGKLQHDRGSFEEFSPQEYRAFLNSILVFFYNNKKQGFNLMFREKLWVPLLCELGLLDIERWPQDGKPALGCDAYCRLITLRYTGDLLPCGLLPSLRCGSIHANKAAIQEAIASKSLDLRSSSPCHSCSYGSFCRGCRGIACGMGGDPYTKDPQCWVQGGK
jgi:radical SAM protein with 4Fe4S-binding SPASM domain